MGLRLLLCPVYPRQAASAGETKIMRNIMRQMASVRQSCYASSAQHPNYGLKPNMRRCCDHITRAQRPSGKNGPLQTLAPRVVAAAQLS